MTRAEAWNQWGNAMYAVTKYPNDEGYGYTECSSPNCERPIPIVEGMAPEFCPACDPNLDD